MGCCGNKRAELTRQNQTQTPRPAASVPGYTLSRMPAETVCFKYIGETALRVRGMFSGNTYRFTAPGAIVAVDGRDAPGIMAAPNLKRIKAAV